MHDEDGFLAAIHLQPADDTARLVFADWLDEQDDRHVQTKSRIYPPRTEARERTARRLHFADRPTPATRRPARPRLARPRQPPANRGLCARGRPRVPFGLVPAGPTQNPNVRSCETCQKTVCYAANSDRGVRNPPAADSAPRSRPPFPASRRPYPPPPEPAHGDRVAATGVDRAPAPPKHPLASVWRENQRLQAEAARDEAATDEAQPPHEWPPDRHLNDGRRAGTATSSARTGRRSTDQSTTRSSIHTQQRRHYARRSRLSVRDPPDACR